MESPCTCAGSASAEAAGPASGARDEVARTISSLIMSANAPKLLRYRGPSMGTFYMCMEHIYQAPGAPIDAMPVNSVCRVDRKSVVSGKSVSVRVDLGGRRIIQKNNNNNNKRKSTKMIIL